jgi:two-component system, NtrC family, sensor kinase
MTRLSLRMRLAIGFGCLMVGIAVFMMQFFPARMAEQARDSAQRRARTVTQVMATAVAPALEFDDADNARQILGWTAQAPDALFAVLVDDHGRRFAAFHPELVPQFLPPIADLVDDDRMVTSAQVVGRGGSAGRLYVGHSLDTMKAVMTSARMTVIEAAVVVLVIGLLGCALVATTLMRPLERLTAMAHDIAKGKKPPRISAVAGGIEVVQMTSALGTMLERLNEANSQLVEASRHAGMAEVATGVLHNVGNILTSVNVGIESVAERVRAIPGDRVRRAGDLLTSSRAGGNVQLEKLDAAVKYLTAIADHLTGEQKSLLEELVTLRGHVDHVNRVVAMQNGYARTGGVHEPTSLVKLIDEAIALGVPAPGRHAIEIERHVPELEVMVDRHRILQILVNLLANARDSLSAYQRSGATTPLRVTVTVTNEDGWLEMRVDDTGGGIDPEKLTKIFHAGFTTKPKGHGYGLHSSALAAEQLGGTLRVTSAGLGLGATFTLRVPMKKDNA